MIADETKERAVVNTKPRPCSRSWRYGQVWRFLPGLRCLSLRYTTPSIMRHQKTQPPKSTLYKRLIMLSLESRDQLESLAQECSDQLGTTISQSAVLRGLVRASTQQPVAPLVAAVEEELHAGVLWGSRPKKGGEQKQ